MKSEGTSRAVERLRKWVADHRAGIAVAIFSSYDIEMVLAERDTLLKIKECFDAIWDHEMSVLTDVRGKRTIKCSRGIWEGVTPEEAVENAVKGLKL